MVRAVELQVAVRVVNKVADRRLMRMEALVLRVSRLEQLPAVESLNRLTSTRYVFVCSSRLILAFQGGGSSGAGSAYLGPR